MKVVSKQNNSKMCIMCGLDNYAGVKAPFYNLEDGSVATLFSFKEIHQSYPGRTHGGIISCMLDELMGRALWFNGVKIFGVTTSMTTKYRKPVPYNIPLKARGYIINDLSRMFTAKAEIFDMQNNLLAESEAKYIKCDIKQVVKEGISVDNEMCYELTDDIYDIEFPPIVI